MPEASVSVEDPHREEPRVTIDEEDQHASAARKVGKWPVRVPGWEWCELGGLACRGHLRGGTVHLGCTQGVWGKMEDLLAATGGGGCWEGKAGSVAWPAGIPPCMLLLHVCLSCTLPLLPSCWPGTPLHPCHPQPTLLHLPHSSHQTVAELMILAGEAVGELGRRLGVPLPYRGQAEPVLPDKNELAAVPPGPCQAVLLRMRMTRSLTLTHAPLRHAGLGLDAYVQFTSPIRR